MDKSQYAARLSAEMRKKGFSFTRPKAERFLDDLAKIMAKGLSKDKKLGLSNFGTFLVSRFGAKIINSPRGDNKKFFMPPTDVIKWRPSMKVRDRAPSETVDEEMFQKLINKEIIDELPTDELHKEQTKKTKASSYDIPINLISKTKFGFISDEKSPISKFVKKLLFDFVNSGNDTLEIKPNKKVTVFLYSLKGSQIDAKIMPAVSHEIIIRKVKNLAQGLSKQSSGTIELAGLPAIKITSNLTVYGEKIVLSII